MAGHHHRAEVVVENAGVAPPTPSMPSRIAPPGDRRSPGSRVEELDRPHARRRPPLVVVARHALLLGSRRHGTELKIAPSGRRLLIAGPSGSGKTTARPGSWSGSWPPATSAWSSIPRVTTRASRAWSESAPPSARPPSTKCWSCLPLPQCNVGVSLVPCRSAIAPLLCLPPPPAAGDAKQDRPPHWIVIDEAHHLFPPSWQPAPLTLPRELGGVLMITVHPEKISQAMLDAVDMALAVGGRTPADVEAPGQDPQGRAGGRRGAGLGRAARPSLSGSFRARPSTGGTGASTQPATSRGKPSSSVAPRTSSSSAPRTSPSSCRWRKA